MRIVAWEVKGAFIPFVSVRPGVFFIFDLLVDTVNG